MSSNGKREKGEEIKVPFQFTNGPFAQKGEEGEMGLKIREASLLQIYGRPLIALQQKGLQKPNSTVLSSILISSYCTLQPCLLSTIFFL